MTARTVTLQGFALDLMFAEWDNLRLTLLSYAMPYEDVLRLRNKMLALGDELRRIPTYRAYMEERGW